MTKIFGMGCFGRHRIQESGEDAELVNAGLIACRQHQTKSDRWCMPDIPQSEGLSSYHCRVLPKGGTSGTSYLRCYMLRSGLA